MSAKREKSPKPSIETACEQLMTVADIARRHCTGREQVHRWIKTGDLKPIIRIGRLIRIHPTALAEFETRHTVGGR